MARIQNPVIGRSKGQAGGMVFTTLNGQNVMKAKPYSYRDANTPVQQQNRALNTIIAILCAELASIARSLFQVQPPTMPAYSRLIQQLQKAASRVMPTYSPVLIGTEIGSGIFSDPISSAIYTTGTGSLTVQWSGDKNPAGFSDDNPTTIVVINKSTNTVVDIVPNCSEYNTGTSTIVITSGLSASDLCVFMSVSLSATVGSDLAKNVKIITAVTTA